MVFKARGAIAYSDGMDFAPVSARFDVVCDVHHPEKGSHIRFGDGTKWPILGITLEVRREKPERCTWLNTRYIVLKP